MIKLIPYLQTILLVFSLSVGFAQDRTITGSIKSASDESPLPGVNIIVKGTTVGTISDFDGNFRLTVPQGGSVLLFTYIGFKTQEVEIGSKSNFTISLAEDVEELSEIVVLGYDTRDKDSFSGSAVQVSTEVLQAPLTTVDQALQGNVAGLNLRASSGTPGAAQDIRIRGISSLNAGNDPLYVIDGVPVVSGDLSASSSTSSFNALASINPADIESITVLKDAASTAMYGARGTNGVIVITTKKGKSGKATYSANFEYGIVKQATDGIPLLNASQFMEVNQEAYANALAVDSIQASAVPDWDALWDGETDTDWKDIITNDHANYQNYNISMTSGTEKGNMYASLGYYNSDSYVIASSLKRISGKLSVSRQLSDKINLSSTFTGSNTTQKGYLEGSGYYSSPIYQSYNLLPIESPYNEDGSYNTDLTKMNNPLAQAEWDRDQLSMTRLLNNTSLSVDILQNLNFTSKLGVDFAYNEEQHYDSRYEGDGETANAQESEYTTRNLNYVWQNMLSYNFDVNSDNKLSFKLIHEGQKNKKYLLYGYGYDYAVDGLYTLTNAATTEASSKKEDWAQESVTFLVNYGFKDFLFLDGTIRTEGSSKFANDYRWGTFGSLGASLVFSNLMDLDWLNLAKLRVSFGKTGNSDIDLNQYQSTLSYDKAYNGASGTYISQMGNTDLTWEKSNVFDIGIDFEIVNRVSGTIEYFNRETYDMLLDVPLSFTTGFDEQTFNVGRMVNDGIEVSLNVDVIQTKNLSWSLGGNLSYIRNEVKSLTDDAGQLLESGTDQRLEEGKEAYTWYMPKWAGVDSETGSPLWYVNDESEETTTDYNSAEYVYHGGRMPNLYGGINTNLNYKGIYFSANLFYSFGNQIYDSYSKYLYTDGNYGIGRNNYAMVYYDRWQQSGDTAKNPKLFYGRDDNSYSQSSRFLYDGSYLRLRNVTIGYNIPDKITNHIKVSNVNIYLRGSNLWTYTYDDDLEFDPEVDSDGYFDPTTPPLKTYTMGLKFNF
ncbi:SusC/RagA family TonB-linked outer membrane protein [Chondrinema litorale]|uniref:SusC/RagA family TonB-linked outer membrane protein n=1 Tax=Chondrinema litorale TaxID=2994555 RepID=UPI002542DD53|nr:TonB-dependent receptor [Chondrinema litorale]UZR94552.1 TonB-dependent receptor [Chondrinema litorale]